MGCQPCLLRDNLHGMPTLSANRHLSTLSAKIQYTWNVDQDILHGISMLMKRQLHRM